MFGPNKPLMRLDSYKSEKRKLQKITNTISVRLTPSTEDVTAVLSFIEEVQNSQRTMSNRVDPAITTQVNAIADLSHNEQIAAVLRNTKLFNNCFFIKYK